MEAIDADAAEGLPEADVKLELHARLISMKGMGQLNRDRSVLGDFGAAVTSGQEGSEIVRNAGFAQPQANRH
jgi:hypothetical protein